MVIDIIAGARPNFVKTAPIIRAIKEKESPDLKFRLIHTGQHYDKVMSDQFFEDLSIPVPDLNLGVGSGSQAEQTARIMVAYEKAIIDSKPDVTLVVGDVTSTMACAITAKKMHVSVIHVEAGIRSGDWRMPEEINRVVTDSITDLYFTTSTRATDNLVNQGVPKEKVIFVGNVMIDSLLASRTRFKKPDFWDAFGLRDKRYLVITLHRPSNVDQGNLLQQYLNVLQNITSTDPIIFPVHPRTRKRLSSLKIDEEKIKIVDPVGYLEFNYLVQHCRGIVTDSGGITEEATVLGVPCITLRTTTERPETIQIGTNEMAGEDPEKLTNLLEELYQSKWKNGGIPELWDGKSAKRIVDNILTHTF